MESSVLIFSYAPAGLGHLRVTEALHHDLPKGSDPILLGAQDQSIANFHRFMSIHPWTRRIMEWTQGERGEKIFTPIYRSWLRARTKTIYQQLTTILDQRIHPAHNILIIATHFGLAHKFGQIKKTLEAERGVRIYLIVQVTDDSPQSLWYVPEADMIFVPSERTKKAFLDYAAKKNLPKTQIEVAAYPVSPRLKNELSKNKFEDRRKQLDPDHKTPINIAIPISGAAVGTAFFQKLIDKLHQLSPRFVFHVISKSTPYTEAFLNEMLKRSYVKLTMAASDRETVINYEDVYENNIISLEITKPSEQTFKALIRPSQIGGSIILFTEAVGRQEFDNLDFLRRHHLMPLAHTRELLWRGNINKEILDEAAGWRGVELPKDPEAAADLIWQSINNNLFLRMLDFEPLAKDDDHAHELNPDGVSVFWKKLNAFLKEQT